MSKLVADKAEELGNLSFLAKEHDENEGLNLRKRVKIENLPETQIEVSKTAQKCKTKKFIYIYVHHSVLTQKNALMLLLNTERDVQLFFIC